MRLNKTEFMLEKQNFLMRQMYQLAQIPKMERHDLAHGWEEGCGAPWVTDVPRSCLPSGLRAAARVWPSHQYLTKARHSGGSSSYTGEGVKREK